MPRRPDRHDLDELADLEAQLASAELDRLELDLDIAEGLVPAWARRALLPHERAARVNFAALADVVDAHVSTITGALRHHRTRIANALEVAASKATTPAELVELVNRVADPARPITADVPGYQRLTRDLEQLVANELAGAYRAGLTSARAEADAQGIPTTAVDALLEQLDTGALDPAIAAQAAASSSAPARVVTQAVANAGARLPLAALDVAEGRARIVDAARDDLAAGLDTDAARVPAQQAHAQGRATAQDALPRAAKWYASELLDSNTCGPCSLVDGAEYPSLEAAREDYPTGTYVGCQGGTRCRGTLVTVWDTEAPPTVNDVAPVDRPEPPQPSPPPGPEPSSPGPTSAARKGKKLTALERDEALVDLAADSEFTPEELRAAWAQLEELRGAARAEAARTQEAAKWWLSGGPGPLDGTRGPGITALAKPPKAVKVTDIYGKTSWKRPEAGGEWDWLEQLNGDELARLQKRGGFRTGGQTPDQLHAALNAANGYDVAGAELYSVEEAVDVWITHNSLAEAAGSVARGRPFGRGHRVSYDQICPQLAGDGWDVEAIIAGRPSEFDADAILHVARHEQLADSDGARRELFDAFRNRGGDGEPGYYDAPPPWQMTTDSYRGELLDLEYRIRAAEFDPAGPADADIIRWNELVPIDDVDDDGVALSPEELHARIVDLAHRAELPGARPLAELNATPEDLARQAADAEARKAAHDQAVTAARSELEARKAAQAEAERAAVDEARRAADEEAARKAAEEAAQRAAEAEARRQAEELERAEAARLEAERRAELERQRAEAERLAREEAARAQAEAEEAARRAAELERQRAAAEAEARRRAAEEQARQDAARAAEEAARRAASPTAGRPAGTLAPLDPSVAVIEDATVAGRALITDTLTQLGEVTGVADDAFAADTAPMRIMWRRGKKGQRKGGHYGPASRPGSKPRKRPGESYAEHAARVREWRSQPLSPEIVVVDVPDGAIRPRFALVHEFGHRADTLNKTGVWHTSQPDVLKRLAGIRQRRSEGGAIVDAAELLTPEELTDPNDALVAFLAKAWEQPVIKDAHLIRGLDVPYHRDPREIWARFYAQWACNELGGEHLADLEHALARQPSLGFTDAEYEAMLPYFLAAMRARGLLAV